MPDAAVGALLLAAGAGLALCGLAWLALSLDVHWQQVRGSAMPAPMRRVLRTLGAAALTASLLVCLLADHPTMAPLVWVMSLAGSAVLVALALAWRPRWLTLFAAWLPATAPPV